MAYDGTKSDLTTATGGGEAEGANGADWIWTRSTGWPPADYFRKRHGNEQIQVAAWKTGGDPDPVIGTGSWPGQAPVPSFLALDNLTDDNASPVTTGTKSITMPSSQINAGIYFTIQSDQKLREFWWMGRIRNGTYTVTATLANAQVSPVTITLTGGSVNNTDYAAWWKCSWRSYGTASSIDLRMERTAIGPNVSGTINNQACVLRIPTDPAYPRCFAQGSP